MDDVPEPIQDQPEPESRTRDRWLVRWGPSIRLGLLLFVIYMANGRMVGSGDTEPARHLPLALWRGDGPYLDRFETSLKAALKGSGKYPYYVTETYGHIVSNYPLGPALLALPFSCPQYAALDLFRPNWEREHCDAYLSLVAKNSQAIIAALIGVALYGVLRNLGLGKVAFPTTLITALGSNLWTVASQAPWQHGPAALALITAIWLLSPPEPTRLRFLLGGLAAAALTAFRPIDVVLSATLFVWVLWHHRGRVFWFVPFPVLVALGLVSYNYWCFGDLRGGYSDLQGNHGLTFSECWDTNLGTGLSGTLISANRGLLIFTPWIAVALLTLPMVYRRIRSFSLVSWLLWALVPYMVLLAKYRWWTTGWSFGPRYWTDVLPLFGLLLGFGLDWAWLHARSALVAFGASAALAVAIQLVGVFYYPSSWNAFPENSDKHRDRLWSWSDSEIGRCLSEGVHPATYRPWSRWANPSAIGLPRNPHDKPRVLGLKWWSEPSARRVTR